MTFHFPWTFHTPCMLISLISPPEGRQQKQDKNFKISHSSFSHLMFQYYPNDKSGLHNTTTVITPAFFWHRSLSATDNYTKALTYMPTAMFLILATVIQKPKQIFKETDTNIK